MLSTHRSQHHFCPIKNKKKGTKKKQKKRKRLKNRYSKMNKPKTLKPSQVRLHCH